MTSPALSAPSARHFSILLVDSHPRLSRLRHPDPALFTTRIGERQIGPRRPDLPALAVRHASNPRSDDDGERVVRDGPAPDIDHTVFSRGKGPFAHPPLECSLRQTLGILAGGLRGTMPRISDQGRHRDVHLGASVATQALSFRVGKPAVACRRRDRRTRCWLGVELLFFRTSGRDLFRSVSGPGGFFLEPSVGQGSGLCCCSGYVQGLADSLLEFRAEIFIGPTVDAVMLNCRATPRMRPVPAARGYLVTRCYRQ